MTFTVTLRNRSEPRSLVHSQSTIPGASGSHVNDDYEYLTFDKPPGPHPTSELVPPGSAESVSQLTGQFGRRIAQL